MKWLGRAAVVVLGAAGLWAQGSADELYSDAIAAAQKGDLAKAEFLLREMRLDAPKDERWATGLVAILEQQNKSQDAIKLAREVGPQFAKSSALHMQVGAVLLKMGRPDEALKELEGALQYAASAGEKATAYSLIGSAHRDMGELDAAISAFRKSKEITGSPSVALAIALGEKGKEEEEISEYIAVLSENPGLPVALNNLAYVWAERGEHLDEALAMAQRAVAFEPGDSNMVDTLAWVYFREGRLAEAEETMLAALANEGGNHPTLREHLAAVMDARGQWTAERRELRKLMDGELSPAQLVRMKELLRKAQK
jgi:predicted Zn-dependent protease